MSLNEADICCRYVATKPEAADWDTECHRLDQQTMFTEDRRLND